jgi:hypothetical protein
MEFIGRQTTMGAGVFTNKDNGVGVAATLHTSGDGLWSAEQRAVEITGLCLSYVNDEDFIEDTFGELRVYFNPDTWDTQQHGLIYTDKLFERELETYLNSQGLAGGDVGYSEQGMQGDNYVSLDVGGDFIASWYAKFGK